MWLMMMMSREETRRRWMMTPSDREIHLRCLIEQKRERWLEGQHLCGRAPEGGGGALGEWAIPGAITWCDHRDKVGHDLCYMTLSYNQVPVPPTSSSFLCTTR